jgi:hypothetical protein
MIGMVASKLVGVVGKMGVATKFRALIVKHPQ